MYTVSQTLATALANKTPQRVLLEFVGANDTVTDTFSNEDIVVSTGVELTEMFNSETDLTIGLCPSAEIRFDMLNDEGQLDDFEFGKFRAWLGARIDSGTPSSSAKTKNFTEDGVSRKYEFTPLGTFIADRPAVVKKKILTITANDQMQLFDKDMPTATALNVTYPITLENLFKKLCAYVSVSYKSSNFTNKALVVPSQPEAFENATMREVLGWIAEAAGSIARFDRDGKLEMAWFNTVTAAYDEHKYTEFTPTWYETAAIDGLHVRNSNSETETVVGTDPTNNYLIQDNPFLRATDQWDQAALAEQSVGT